MPIARFGEMPPFIFKSGFPDPIKIAKFEALEEIYNSLPTPVKLLFSFNTREIVYYNFGPLANYAAYVDYDVAGSVKPRIRIDELIRGESISKILIHELAHTLDPYLGPRGLSHEIPQDYFPAWLYRAAQSWKDVLKQEPDSPELNQELSDFERVYITKPNEQWANRLALTLVIDYMIPAGSIGDDDAARRHKLSAEQFKARWPKSYKFFHKYIRTIMAHAPKK